MIPSSTKLHSPEATKSHYKQPWENWQRRCIVKRHEDDSEDEEGKVSKKKKKNKKRQQKTRKGEGGRKAKYQGVCKCGGLMVGVPRLQAIPLCYQVK